MLMLLSSMSFGVATTAPEMGTSAITGHRAFYTVFSPMLDAPDWPHKYLPYVNGLVVMNPFNATR